MQFSAFQRDLKNAVVECRSEALLKMPRPEYVYAMHSDAFPSIYKIGRTRNIANRLIQLNVGMPHYKYRLVVQYVTYKPNEDERHTHDALKEYHVSGEHYELSLDVLLAHFKTKRDGHMAGRANVRNLVHMRRAFVKWVNFEMSNSEIEDNANSSAPINEMARAAVNFTISMTQKLELVEKVELVKKRKLENVASFCDLMDRLRPNWKSDQHLVLQTEDWLKNAAFTMPLAIENGSGTGPVQASISIG
jgi:hypothetical protein